jgi:hypothetical protein
MKSKIIDLLCGASYTRYDIDAGHSYQHRLVDDEIHARAVIDILERAGIELPNARDHRAPEGRSGASTCWAPNQDKP